MLFRRRRFDADLNEELRTHLAEREAAYVRDGMTAADARRRARLDFGNPSVIHEQSRDVWLIRWLDTIRRDLRIALRSIRRAPGFAAAVIGTLALGIGANTAMFTIVDAALLRPLPFAEPHRLVMIGDAGDDGTPGQLGYATIEDIRESVTSLAALAAVRTWSPTLVTDDGAERVPALRVSREFFGLLGVRPVLGRDFLKEEDNPDQWRVVIISDGLWRRRFGADPSAIGRSVRMNDRDYRIVGVLPPDFEPLISSRYYQPAEMWAPLGYDVSLSYACRSCQHLKVVGRLADGATAGTAAGEINALRDRLRARFPDDYARGFTAVQPLRDALAGPVRRAVLVLFAAVALVLLIACANVANLFLTRAIGRRREMTLRAALGAGRARIASQVVVEALVLGLCGGALGVALAAALLGGAATLAPVTLPRADQIALDGRVLGFAAAISIITAILFGLLPALRASAAGLGGATAIGSRGSVGAPGGRARAVLVAIDLALALLLLTGAGLMMRSVSRLFSVNPGFNAERVMTLQFSLVGTAYAEDTRVEAFQRQLLERVEALPGVESAALAGQIPLGGNYDTWGVRFKEARPAGEAPVAFQRYSVTPSYRDVMGIPLKRGRFISAKDQRDGLPVAVLSESAARAAWPGADPIGRQFQIGGPSGAWRTVVGVAGDVRHVGLGTPPDPQMYLPQTQVTDSFLVLAIRSAGPPPATLAGAARDAIRALDKTVPVYEAAPYDTLVARSAAAERFVMRLLAAFATIALLLAAVGLYGVVSYAVAHRRRELAVRMALGARPSNLMALVFTSGAGAIGGGLAAGLAASYALTRFLGALLHGVEPLNPFVFGVSALVLLLVAVAAHAVPVRRALSLSPAAVLTQE